MIAKSIENRSPEEETLDRAITSIDPLLRASLQRDQKRQRRKYAILGGVLMAVFCIGVLLALVFSGGLPTTAQAAAPTASELEIDRLEEASDLTAEGWMLWESRKLTESAAKFKEALKLDPQSDNAWNGLGWSLANAGKRTQAVEAFNECIKIKPEHPAALNGLGQLHLADRKYDEAEKYFLAAKNASAAWSGLVRLYLLQERYDDAGKWLAKLKDSPGATESTMKEYAEAIANQKVSDELRRKIEPRVQEESSTDDLSRRGWQLFYQNKHRPAKAAFQQVLDKKPDDSVALNGMAFTLLNSGSPDEAQPLFEKLLKADPNHDGALNGLARVLMSQDKVDEAIVQWMKLEAQGDQVTAATHGLALAHFRRKEYAKAIPFLERSVKESPTNEMYVDMLAKAKKALDK